jgi:hypothetical protein
VTWAWRKLFDALRGGVRQHLEGDESGNRSPAGLAFSGRLDGHCDNALSLRATSQAALAGLRAAHLAFVHLDDAR